MSPQASGPLQPPGADEQQASGNPPGGGFPSPAPAVPDPNEMGKRLVVDLVTTTRRLGVKYPAMMQEVREITDRIAPKMLQKLVASNPAPEPQSPPV